MNKPIKKLYYPIGEVSEITGLKQYVLRYWETEFPSLAPAKNRAGNRIYRDKDIRLIQYIKYLLYDKRFTIEGAKQKLKELKPEDWEKITQNGDWSEIVNPPLDNEQLEQLVRQIKGGLKEILDLINSW